MILWRPHTETPDEPGTVAIIAVMLGDLRDQLHYALAAHRAATEAHNHG